MSGHNIPYQLRPNKFVERQLFLDILGFTRIWNGPAKYLYASMGGRFLEDFRVVNDRFAIEEMISIEVDPTTWQRQRFNQMGFIDCRKQRSDEFIRDFQQVIKSNSDKKLIVWLDYAAANERGGQLGEFRQLLSQLGVGDIAKITINANYQSFRRRASPLTRNDYELFLRKAGATGDVDFDAYISSFCQITEPRQAEPVPAADDSRPTIEEHSIDGPNLEPSSTQEGTEVGRPAQRLVTIGRDLTLSDDEHETICIENIKEQLGEYLPTGGMTSEQLDADKFATFLCAAIKRACLKGVEGSDFQPVPLGSFRYKDGEHQMLTVTCILTNDELRTAIVSDETFANWPFRSSDWDDVKDVTVPDLSIRERHYLDSRITPDRRKMHDELPFRFDKNDAKSLQMLEAYLMHYRRYPSYVRVY